MKQYLRFVRNAVITAGFIFFTAFPAGLHAIASGDEARTVTTLATVPLGILFNDNSYTAVASFRGITYFVWINSDDRPKVGMLKNGVFTSAYLSPITTYTIRNDGHHYFSLGVDNDGYIHVTGDMHNYPAADMTLYPAEYKGKIIMYWVSKQPESVDFEFAGGDAARAMPGYGFSYHSFQYDQDRNLYFLSRIKVHKGGHKPGEMGLGLFRYNTATRSWSEIGGYAPSNPAAIYRSIAWEDNGDADAGGWYQGFRAGARFDLNDRMHFAASIWNDSTKSDPTHVLYGYSDDRGLTFRRGDGSSVNVPIRVDAGANQGDIVAGPGAYDLFASVAFNLHGDPLVIYSENRERSYSSYKYRLPGQPWSAQIQDPFNTYFRAKYHIDTWGVLTLMSPAGQYRRLNDFTSAGYNSLVNSNYSYVCVDELGLRENGEFIGLSKSTGAVNLVKMKIAPNLAALPAALTPAGIGTVGSAVAGQFNGVMALGGSAAGMAGSADSLQWAYQQVSGDLDMKVRVISLGWSSDAAQAGVMLRQDSGTGAKTAAAAITYRQGAKLITRDTASAAATTAVNAGHTASEWLRLVKQGSLVTAYRSDNGQVWEAIGSKTVAISGSFLAGIFYASADAAASQAHFDNYSISAALSTATFTRTRTPVPVNTPTYTRTRTATPANTKTNTPQLTKTFTASFTKTSTAVNTATFTAVSTKTRTPTLTRTRTLTPTLTITLTSSRTFTASSTSSPTMTITITSSCSSTASATASPTMTITITYYCSLTPTLTLTLTSSYSSTPTATSTKSVTRTPSPSLTMTITITYSCSFTPTLTLTLTLTSYYSSTPTLTVTIPATRTPSPSLTITSSCSSTPSVTPTLTLTLTSYSSPTPTFTSTSTNTPGTATVLAFDGPDPVICFPNPVKGNLSVNIGFNIKGYADTAEIRLFTVAGRLIRKIPVSRQFYNGRHSILLDPEYTGSLAGGSYYYEIRLSNGNQNIKSAGTLIILR